MRHHHQLRENGLKLGQLNLLYNFAHIVNGRVNFNDGRAGNNMCSAHHTEFQRHHQLRTSYLGIVEIHTTMTPPDAHINYHTKRITFPPSK